MPRIKGGYEVLNVVSGGPEVELIVDAFLGPPSYMPGGSMEARWLTSAIPLNKIPVQATGDKIKIWELVKASTGLFQTQPQDVTLMDASQPYNGPQSSQWAASGLPASGFPSAATGKPPFDNTIEPQPLLQDNQMFGQLFQFNPWMDNAKYYVNKQLGSGSAIVGDSNSTVVLMADEDGFGVMCPTGFCYLSSLDYVSKLMKKDTAHDDAWYQQYQLPRYFKLYLRQRWVKSPVVMMDLFQQMLNSEVQGYNGLTSNVEQATLSWGEVARGPEGMLNNSGISSAPGHDYSSSSSMETTRHSSVMPPRVAKLNPHIPQGATMTMNK
ncbi:VP1 [Thetapolyomavirus trepennellii]|uniref:VP1 n=1 Tax=Thetapolyomavirus trepennellii TaxID=2170103 RepID=A0A0E3JE56_9POLY|nr:VP1 [Thetapolyomavirus trepennellii]AJZ72668.1 VP1 [Thetapolyomavirus trepennellii]